MLREVRTPRLRGESGKNPGLREGDLVDCNGLRISGMRREGGFLPL